MSGTICPYLGIEEDKDTAVAFPSPRNRCFRSGNAAIISDLQQDRYCLQYAYAQCPVYLLKQSVQARPASTKPVRKMGAEPKPPARQKPPENKPATRVPAAKPVKPAKPRGAGAAAKSPVPNPKPFQPASNSRRTKNKVITGLMSGGVIAILLAAVLILPVYGARIFSAKKAPASLVTTTFEPQSGLIHNQISPIAAVVTVTDTWTPTGTATRRASVTPITTRTAVKPTRTATRKPTRTQTPRQPAIVPPAASPYPNCGVPYGWVQYIVRGGDTLTSISQRTNVSVYQLQTANCMGSSTMLYAGMTLYVPFLPPAPPIPTLVPPTRTLKPSPAPATSTPVPTSTVKPTEPPETPSTVAPTPIIPSATPLPVEPEPTVASPVVPEGGGVN